MNPILRGILRTPFARFVKPFGLLEFSGRRSGRRYRIPVGFYDAGDLIVVNTPAAWKENFAVGLPATIHRSGRVEQRKGMLVRDPARVARTFNVLLDGGVSPRLLSLDIPAGHKISEDDVKALGRAVIEFRRP